MTINWPSSINCEPVADSLRIESQQLWITLHPNRDRLLYHHQIISKLIPNQLAYSHEKMYIINESSLSIWDDRRNDRRKKKQMKANKALARQHKPLDWTKPDVVEYCCQRPKSMETDITCWCAICRRRRKRTMVIILFKCYHLNKALFSKQIDGLLSTMRNYKQRCTKLVPVLPLVVPIPIYYHSGCP